MDSVRTLCQATDPKGKSLAINTSDEDKRENSETLSSRTSTKKERANEVLGTKSER